MKLNLSKLISQQPSHQTYNLPYSNTNLNKQLSDQETNKYQQYQNPSSSASSYRQKSLEYDQQIQQYFREIQQTKKYIEIYQNKIYEENKKKVLLNQLIDQVGVSDRDNYMEQKSVSQGYSEKSYRLLQNRQKCNKQKEYSQDESSIMQSQIMRDFQDIKEYMEKLQRKAQNYKQQHIDNLSQAQAQTIINFNKYKYPMPKKNSQMFQNYKNHINIAHNLQQTKKPRKKSIFPSKQIYLHEQTYNPQLTVQQKNKILQHLQKQQQQIRNNIKKYYQQKTIINNKSSQQQISQKYLTLYKNFNKFQEIKKKQQQQRYTKYKDNDSILEKDNNKQQLYIIHPLDKKHQMCTQKIKKLRNKYEITLKITKKQQNRCNNLIKSIKQIGIYQQIITYNTKR